MEGRVVCLFWVRASVGIAGTEPADELARRVALTKKTAVDYDRFPLSHAKRVMRAAILEEWQERYAEGNTGKVTKCFFPRVEQAYRILKQLEMTSQIAQTLTGYGGFAHYLFRFKLKDSPYCACDPAKEQDILHALEECCMFMREGADLEIEINSRVKRQNFPEILENSTKSLAFNSEPGLGLSRLRLRSPALISDLGTVPYSDSEHALGSNFNSTLNFNQGSVLDTVLIRSRLSILLFISFAISIPLPLTVLI
ncbi:Retrovirus-related Pol polyprotein from type-1 retrotransposable element R1 3 [Eumeta japonica]|uniref:Retrovirus-related Pol polyprotein from type-1 retrotransposable element R1 3 n=1 Tax=Eumeta variegata TaxID=151549 RepID=A0A4C1YD16_EUMVA|nr:Retrovirus-related Pol polyprotein from type-1 retrotransposable element R1 3 [Eumeta japonica]